MTSFKTDLIGVCSAIAGAIVLLAILLFGLGNIAFGSTPTNNIGANVAVLGTCAVNVVNTLIAFGGGSAIAPGSNTFVNNVVNVNDLNGNEGANILIYGNNWIVPTYTTFNFLVTNTVWDYTIHSGSIVGNQLTNTVTDTYTQLIGGGNKNIYFGADVPLAATGNTAVPQGNYVQSIYIEISCP
jgi:hypothetical protein